MIRVLLLLTFTAALAESPTASAAPSVPPRPPALELRPLKSDEGYLTWRTVVVIDGRAFHWHDCPSIDGMRLLRVPEKEGDFIRVLELWVPMPAAD